MTTKRTETVIIRLTPDEKQSLLLRKTKPRLAMQYREISQQLATLTKLLNRYQNG